jgi:magnesium chelatase family protein
MLAKIHAMTTFGIDPLPVEVEVDIARGMPAFALVGLGDASVQESRHRVHSAIKNSGMRFPGTRVTVNLAPADIRKIGPLFDLPIAIGLLVASEQVPTNILLANHLFLGELALEGKLRHISSVLPIVAAAKERGMEGVFVPISNAKEASLVDGISVYGAETLSDVVMHLSGNRLITPEPARSLEDFCSNEKEFFKGEDFSFIRGQEQAKRALEIAAAGSHNILMCGSPGSGKTLMAKAFRGILPKMTKEESFEVSNLYSIAGLLPPDRPIIKERPFRTVHHTASSVSIVGGGKNPSPGEISLSHRGVLFLDEIAEFPSAVIEVLRQPLEDRVITVSRVSGTCSFPAHFSLIAAMNPCPCGYYNVPHTEKECTCTPVQISKYQKRLSGPLLDRIDLYIDISPVKFEKLSGEPSGEKTEIIAQRVQKARTRQEERFQKTKKHIASNAEMGVQDIKQFCTIPPEGEALLKQAMRQLALSARAFHRILKVSRTIADLAGEENISVVHIAEALQYRPKFSNGS